MTQNPKLHQLELETILAVEALGNRKRGSRHAE